MKIWNTEKFTKVDNVCMAINAVTAPLLKYLIYILELLRLVKIVLTVLIYSRIIFTSHYKLYYYRIN